MGVRGKEVARQDSRNMSMPHTEIMRGDIMIPTLYESFRHWSEGAGYLLSDLRFDDGK